MEQLSRAHRRYTLLGEISEGRAGLTTIFRKDTAAFPPNPLREFHAGRGAAAPSPRPSPRSGEGDDLSLAPFSLGRPGLFSPSPRRGEGARRAGEGARRPSPSQQPAWAETRRLFDDRLSAPHVEIPSTPIASAGSDGASPSRNVPKLPVLDRAARSV